ncbi:PQ-loop domain-containing transporter [Ureaplasma parvum]|uniref:PQ-loop domain-containing transporter n=1 Tax=Ureaplasma parvum TaxID=134821 RepID=UPI0026F28C28|nr:PQ-loop domain-containing transporter [Ureaplasma parvum]
MLNVLNNVSSSSLYSAGSISINELVPETLTASGISIAISVFSVIGTIVIALSVLPQTIKTLREKDTASLSLLLFLLNGIATAFLTLYGIGLVTVHPNSFAFLVDIKNGMYIYNREEWVAGYLICGIFLIMGEALCSVTSFIVLFYKVNNMIKAKKMGMSEQEYYEKQIRPFLKVKGAN